MVAKRIIPCLDVKDGRTVKGVRFTGIKDCGCPVELAKRYVDEGADELVLLDISASDEGRTAFLPVVEAVAKELSVPFTVGGGIASLDQASRIINAGVDKISLNTAAVRSPDIIHRVANKFGSQSVVVAIDAKKVEGVEYVFIRGGKEQTSIHALEWIRRATELGAGEILLTSIDFDGTKTGFNLELLKTATSLTPLPVIASGGAGQAQDFIEVFQKTKVSAALAAGIFHGREISIAEIKKQLTAKKIEVRI